MCGYSEDLKMLCFKGEKLQFSRLLYVNQSCERIDHGKANIDQKYSPKLSQSGASETASYQRAGEGEADVLPEAKGGPEGCQIQVQREGVFNLKTYIKKSSNAHCKV